MADAASTVVTVILGLALIAVARKLIVTANAVIKTQTPFRA